MTEQTTYYPPELAKAIVGVMASVQKLSKGEKNDFDNYKFTSIDNFLEALNPLCAENGIFIVMNEIECAIIPSSAKKPFLKITFGIVVVHESGVASHPVTREVQVMATGAQAYGIAQSYVLKQFMRSLFLIPTGEKDDADFQKAEELPHTPQRKQPDMAEKSAEIIHASNLPKGKARDLYQELQADLDMCTTADDLGQWFNDRGEDLNALPDDWKDSIRERYRINLIEAKKMANGEAHV